MFQCYLNSNCPYENRRRVSFRCLQNPDFWHSCCSSPKPNCTDKRSVLRIRWCLLNTTSTSTLKAREMSDAANFVKKLRRKFFYRNFSHNSDIVTLVLFCVSFYTWCWEASSVFNFIEQSIGYDSFRSTINYQALRSSTMVASQSCSKNLSQCSIFNIITTCKRLLSSMHDCRHMITYITNTGYFFPPNWSYLINVIAHFARQ